MSKELAIIIDCWEQLPAVGINLLSYNIINFISLKKVIEYVVLASYDVPYNDDENTIWRYNYDKVFFNDASIAEQYLYNLADTARKSVEYNNTISIEQTDKALINTVFANKFQISLRHYFELDHILKQYPAIDTIWFFGAGWDQCVKNRELGWRHMKLLTGKNLMTISTCIGPFLKKVDDDPDWESTDLGDFIYRHK